MRTVLKEIARDAVSRKLIPSLSIGLVNGVIMIILEVSFAAMVFSGDLGVLATRGAALTLFGSFILCLFIALASSCRVSVTLAQDAPVAVLAVVGATVVLSMPSAPADSRFMTVAAVLALTSAVTGLAFWAIGRFGLVNLFRFLPYPVMGGFLAGTGWMLSVGSIGVMCDVPLEISTLGQLATAETAWRWGPGVAFAAILFVVMRRWSHFVVLPAALLLGASLFFAGFTLAGMDLEDVKQGGFVLTGMPDHGLWPPFGIGDLALIDWHMVLVHLPVAFTVALVAIVGMVLNLSGLELALNANIDMDREFRMCGFANLLAGAGGSFPGYPSLALSLLAQKASANSRLSGIASALVVGAVLFVGGGFLGFFPKPLVGGLLLLLGLFFLSEWLVDSRKRLPVIDYLLIVAICLTIGLRGFLEGVVLGTAVTVVIFVIRFSRVSVVRERSTLAERRSRKSRSIPDLHILRADGTSAVIYELTGYIFFGSASALVGRLRKDMIENGIRLVILDSHRVTGFDVSGVFGFHRYVLFARSAGAKLAFSAAPAQLADALSATVPSDVMESVPFFPDLDRALDWAEDEIIEEARQRMEAGSLGEHKGLFERSVDELMERLESLERFEALVEKLGPWLVRRQYEAGEILIARHESFEGMHLVLDGTTTEQTDSGQRRGVFGQGDVIATGAAFGEVRAAHAILADDSLATFLLTPESRLRLESEAADIALELDRFLLILPQLIVDTAMSP